KILAQEADPKTSAQAPQTYLKETRPLAEAAFDAAVNLVHVHSSDVMGSAEETRTRYANSIKLIYGTLGGALLLGLAMALLLARSIVNPLRNAVEIADAVKQGRLDNYIEVDGSDETSQLLASLSDMQSALKARDEKDADSRGQIAAINRSQAVIEF